MNSMLRGSSQRDLKEKLRRVGIRPTRQRICLAWILFGKGDRHVTAEMLYEEALKAKLPVSLATVYNTLRQFTNAGLLRRVTADLSKTFFDTNNSTHHHFFIEDKNNLVDIVAGGALISRVPAAPKGYEIVGIEVIVRLQQKVR